MSSWSNCGKRGRNMTRVSDIAAFLAEEIPPALKEDYDNVGLLCGFPDREVSCVLVSLDVDLEAIQEAESMGAQLIVAHHPVIFSPLQAVLENDPVGRRVIRLIQKGISAVCMHTNLDRLPGGVNSALANAVGAHSAEMLDMGCTAFLTESVGMDTFLARVKAALGASGIRYHDAGRPVGHIALCGGAGGDIIYEAARLGCDTALTGEIKHHQWLDGQELGLNLIEAGHFATENVVLPQLRDMLSKRFPEMRIAVSARGPVTREL